MMVVMMMVATTMMMMVIMMMMMTKLMMILVMTAIQPGTKLILEIGYRFGLHKQRGVRMEPGLDPRIPAPENPLSAAHLHANTAAPDSFVQARPFRAPFRANTAAGIRPPVSAGARPVLPAMPTARTAGRSCPPLNRPVLTLPHGTSHRKVVLHEAERLVVLVAREAELPGLVRVVPRSLGPLPRVHALAVGHGVRLLVLLKRLI